MSEECTQRVYLFFDEKDIACLMKIVLENHNFIVEFDTNTPDSIQKALEFQPDLIIIDQSNYLIFRQIRMKTNFNDIPIGIINYSPEKPEEFQSNMLKIDGFIQHPFGANEFVKQVNLLLQGCT